MSTTARDLRRLIELEARARRTPDAPEVTISKLSRAREEAFGKTISALVNGRPSCKFFLDKQEEPR